MPLSPSRAIIDLQAYEDNLNAVRNLLPAKCALIAVVKANAYGHGMEPVARRAIDAGAQMLGVSNVEEGVQLRQAGIEAPIIVLKQPAPGAMPAAIEYGLRMMLSEIPAAERVGELARKVNRVVPIHCKIDCGMGRQGFDIAHAERDIQYLTRVSNIDIEGVAMHFPSAELKEDPYTINQIKSFKNLLRQLDKVGVPYEMVHAANSAAIINYQTSCFNTVRPGLITYGVAPTSGAPLDIPIKPVLRWETRISLIRELGPGQCVGYGRTFTTAGKSRFAILPVGYADGYKHALSNNADVLIKGRRCRVRGSVCMDQIIVDITGIPGIEIDDTAILIGSEGSQTITAEELAQKAQTIPYDILTGIGPRVRREYR